MGAKNLKMGQIITQYVSGQPYDLVKLFSEITDRVLEMVQNTSANTLHRPFMALWTLTQWWDQWMSAPVVNDRTIWQPAFIYLHLNHFRTNQGHCASCRKKWGIAATKMCPCGKFQPMSHIINSCSPAKLESELHQLHSADDIATKWLKTWLVNALDNKAVNMCYYWHNLACIMILIGPIPWGHSGPLCHALSLWTSMHKPVSYTHLTLPTILRV